MPEVEPITASLLLADFAESVNGKLYMQGGGWSRIKSGRPVSVAVALIVRVPYGETNIKHNLSIRLVDEDGAPYPPGPTPMSATTTFEVGRPPGMRHGEQSNVVVAFTVHGMQFTAGGYRMESYLDDEPLAVAPFVATEDLP